MGNITTPIYRYPCKHCQKQPPVKVGIFYSWFQLHSIKQPWFKCKCTGIYVFYAKISNGHFATVKRNQRHSIASAQFPTVQWCSVSRMRWCWTWTAMVRTEAADELCDFCEESLEFYSNINRWELCSAVKRSDGFTISLKAPSRDFTLKTLLIIYANKLVRPYLS